MASKRCSCAPDELCNLCANDYFNGVEAWAPECYYVNNLIVDKPGSPVLDLPREIADAQRAIKEVPAAYFGHPSHTAPHFDYREPYRPDAPL